MLRELIHACDQCLEAIARFSIPDSGEPPLAEFPTVRTAEFASREFRENRSPKKKRSYHFP